MFILPTDVAVGACSAMRVGSGFIRALVGLSDQGRRVMRWEHDCEKQESVEDYSSDLLISGTSICGWFCWRCNAMRLWGS